MAAPRVAHTGITVVDLEAAVGFWTGVLGAREQRRFSLDGDFAASVTGVPGAQISAAVVVLGEHRIELLEYLAPADRAEFAPRPCDVGSWHLALEVDDLDAVVARCAAAGWQVPGAAGTMTSGPRAGTRFVYLRDADGATLELIEPARQPASPG